jgi:hypothetical protein
MESVTIEQVIAWEPCGRYTLARIEKLFAGREQLTPDDIRALGVPKADIDWVLDRMRVKATPHLPQDDPITVKFLEGREVLVQIDTAEFIRVMFDEADETAQAIQQLLEWTHDWIQGESQGWMRTPELFRKEIWKMLAHVYTRKDETLVFMRIAYIQETDIADLSYYRYQVSDEQWLLLSDGDRYMEAAAKAFPVAAIKLLHEAEMCEPDWVRSFTTANGENDFDRDWVMDAFLEDGYGSLYAIVDYSRVALVRDPDYIYSWTCRPSCYKHHEGWECMHFWREDFEKNHTKTFFDHSGIWVVNVYINDDATGTLRVPDYKIEVSDRDMELAFPGGVPDLVSTLNMSVYKKTRMRHESIPPASPPHPTCLAIDLVPMLQVEAGQILLPGLEYEWPHDVSPADAQALVRHYREFIELDEEDEEDYAHPTALIDGEDGAVSYPPLDVNSGLIPAGTTRLLCPHCGTYSVGLSNEVYGF